MYFSFLLFSFSVILLGNFDKIFLPGYELKKVFFIILIFSFMIKFLYRKIALRSVLLFTVFSVYALSLACFSLFYSGNIGSFITEVSPYFIPIIFLFLIDFLSKEELVKINEFILLLLLLFSAIHLLYPVLFILGDAFSIPYYAFIKYFYDSAKHLDSLAYSEYYLFFPRLQVGSSILLLLGLFYVEINKNEYTKLKYVLLTLYFIASVLVTQSRILIVSVVLFYLLLPCYRSLFRSFTSKFSRTIMFGFTLFTPLILTFIAIFFDITNILGLSKGDLGDSERYIQLLSFIESLNQNVLFGTGLGSSSIYVRSIESPWLYELSLLSFIYKLGLIGFLVFVVLALLMFFLKYKTNKEDDYVVSLSFIFVFVLSSNTNPYLSNFAGGFILCMVYVTLFGRGKLNYD
ncbi:hypothetical protein [Shewanella algicola]|uniref:hypothetical protein n=1 Tax=Shewanella algicola TaxID=640633 RepID=UPI0024946734|nr:hypothetical protein [Shewanella algicola]